MLATGRQATHVIQTERSSCSCATAPSGTNGWTSCDQKDCTLPSIPQTVTMGCLEAGDERANAGALLPCRLEVDVQLVAPSSADFGPVAVQADLHAVGPSDPSRASPALPPQRVGLKDSDHWVSACASGKPNRAAVGTGGLAQARPTSPTRLTCASLRIAVQA